MIVTFINLQGGVGRTTSALALAHVASQEGFSVEVLDADPQGMASKWAREAKKNNVPFAFDVNPANRATLQRRLNSKSDYIFIDCPSAGQIIDAAISVADFVIVPTSTSYTDLRQTEFCVETMKELNQAYAVLITKAKPKTTAYKECKKYLDDNQVSYFDTAIPKKEAVNRSFGKEPENLAEYKEIFDELKGL